MTTATPPRPGLGGVRVAVLLLVAVLAAGCTAPRQRHGPARPAPAGAASSPEPALGPTGLRLLVADVPAPFVLHVDRGTVQPITGLPTDGDRGVGVLPVAGGALVLSLRHCDRCRAEYGVHLLRRGTTDATRLGTAMQAVPSRDGQGLWMLGGGDAGRCTVREVGLDGRPRHPARRVSCRTGLVAELPAGLLVSSSGAGGSDWHGALLGRDGVVTRFADPQARPVVGNLVLSGVDRHTPLVLHDLGTGARTRLRWPSRDGDVLGEVAGDPSGRLAVVQFARFTPGHRVDLWLLDTRTRRWRHLPGMPARMVPKVTDVQWTADGAVVLLSGDLLGVWRPGAPRLAVRRVRPPRGPGGEFVIW